MEHLQHQRLTLGQKSTAKASNVDASLNGTSAATSIAYQLSCDNQAERQSDSRGFEFGLYTFGELTPDAQTGKAISAQQRLAEILAAAKLADSLGLDVFAVGEHHRLDMSVSATSVVLAAIAATTQRIRLASAVTILSTADPVRVFEDFSTVDLISGGRAELIVGRGVFTESFPLFGYDLADYDDLFVEKLDLLLKLNGAERIGWQGRFRPPLHNAPIPPRPAQSRLPVWVGTGGTQGSIIRAGALGLPLALANISIPPAKLAPVIDLYRRTGMQAGHNISNLRLSIGSHVHVQENSQDALNEFFPHYASYFCNHTPAQYRAQEITRADYEDRAGSGGALFVGSPQQIIDKVLYERELFGHQRFLMQIDIGGLPFGRVAQVIELFSTKIAPVIRREVSRIGFEAR
jgi:probable LLM family oxidoreductase